MLILLIGLALIGVAVALALRAVAMPRARAAERLEIIEAYGFSRDTTSAAPFIADPEGGAMADFVTAIGAAVSTRFGRVRESDLRPELMAAGLYSVSPRTLLGYRAFAAVLLPLLILLLGASSGSAGLYILLAFVGGASGWMLPLVIVRRKARVRLTQIDRELPELIDILVVTVEAGLGFSGSLRIAARELRGPLQDELLLTLQEQSMGLTISEALEHQLKRCDTPAMRSFVRSVTQGEALGVSTGVIMRNLAVEMRKRRRASAEEQAQKAPIKMLFPLVFLIFPTLFIVLLGPAAFRIADTF